METVKTDITVIGGGITGLTLAYYLKRAGKKVIVLEKANHSGGVIGTITRNGFTFESGPNTGVIGSVELVELFHHLKGKVEMDTANPEAKYRWIFKNGKWESLPTGLFSAVKTPLFTMGDKIRILGEPFRKPGSNPDESVAGMVVRRLGKSFLDYAVNPFISGVYGGDPDTLITRYALPKLYNLEQKYGSFIKGTIKKHKDPKTELEKQVTREVFSAKGGLKNLTDALASEIGEEKIIKNCLNVQVFPVDNGFLCKGTLPSGDGFGITSGRVVTTVNGIDLAGLLPFISDNRIRSISNTRYAKIVQASVCYSKWEGKQLKAFGGLVPAKEKREILGILFPSSVFSGRAPEGGAILSVFMGGINNPSIFERDDKYIESMVLAEISSTLHCSRKPDMFNIFRYRHAIPQYEISTGERLRAIAGIQEEYPGLFLAGNIRDGIGMSDRVKQARQLADSLTGTI